MEVVEGIRTKNKTGGKERRGREAARDGGTIYLYQNEKGSNGQK